MESTYQNFTLFPHLPPELRDRICLLALPIQPRLIPYAATETPSLAYVNHESRLVFLSVYTKCFLTADCASMQVLPYPISPYANLSIDTLFLFWDIRPKDRYPFPSSKWMTPEGRRKLRHIAVGLGLWISLRGHMHEFAGLESLTFAMGMTLPHEKLRNLRNRGYLLEIDEKHYRWEEHKDFWEELKGGLEDFSEELKHMSLAEVVDPEEFYPSLDARFLLSF
ncbi:uncharacterized protein LY89DRAFT_777210 [Mollisia scopiformis]|uniref:2EXR domain-containing protein n=1 Tax=Mollisia scopiformis TaxID=149040 RepID=A0A194XTU8_MOLSC|nr:uncharacterized protein LY89DRAFT_777210 [Mollisia scopiformis]KUJ23464.1 hypothetical protein LY89DRAFT_777210 [Mollisia scopiformis]